MTEPRAGPVDEEGASVAIPPLTHAQEAGLRPGCTVAGDEAKPGGHLAPALQAVRLPDRGDERGGAQRTDPLNVVSV